MDLSNIITVATSALVSLLVVLINNHFKARSDERSQPLVDSEAASNLVGAADTLVEKYVTKCTSLEGKMERLDKKIAVLKKDREEDRQKIEWLSDELRFCELQIKDLYSVNIALTKQVIEEASLVPVAQPKTREQIRAEMQ